MNKPKMLGAGIEGLTDLAGPDGDVSFAWHAATGWSCTFRIGKTARRFVQARSLFEACWKMIAIVEAGR